MLHLVAPRLVCPAPGSIQTHNLSVTRHVHYRCSTTAAPCSKLIFVSYKKIGYELTWAHSRGRWWHPGFLRSSRNSGINLLRGLGISPGLAVQKSVAWRFVERSLPSLSSSSSCLSASQSSLSTLSRSTKTVGLPSGIAAGKCAGSPAENREY